MASSRLYSLFYDGKTIITTVTNSSNTANNWAQEMLNTYANNPTVVGVDIEWRPHPIQNMSNNSATIQLCINNKCLILQLFFMDEHLKFSRFFFKIPISLLFGLKSWEILKNSRMNKSFKCKKSADIRELAKIRWPGRFRRPGLKDLARDVCGLNMLKPRHVTMSNWEARI